MKLVGLSGGSRPMWVVFLWPTISKSSCSYSTDLPMTYDVKAILKYCGKSSLWHPGLDRRLPLEAVSQPLLAMSGRFRGFCGRSWLLSMPLCAVVGQSWACLMASVGAALGASVGFPELLLGICMRSWAALGSLWGRSWAALGASVDNKTRVTA